jgi:hypothetical protein
MQKYAESNTFDYLKMINNQFMTKDKYMFAARHQRKELARFLVQLLQPRRSCTLLGGDIGTREVASLD